MSKVLLAVERDSSGKAKRVYCGGIPWSGIMKIDVQDMFDKEIVLDNARISDKMDVICTQGDIRKYTTIVNGNTSKKSYVVLAKAINDEDEIYFITDGLSNPLWVKSRDIKDKLLKDKATLANSSIDLDSEEPKLVPTEKPFLEADYIKLQLEYRKFLKSTK